MMKLVIDYSLCAGFGDCAAAAPQLFDLDKQGKALVRSETTDESAAAFEAAVGCPMGAISVVELKAA
ncbi:MAG TPA: ferredoxin [Gaiellaceae bacterium]|nr:ferredoxin [Gaiellaceae bacterium]